ncbi:unnamed protein product [Cyprideis torosa]|uniref:Uncharacterized protein n=1 Tax=Cyprideis torosa TaxID=163714 RepID=A0A7R8ZNM6_9CRUS|nr:unnamed protein product [Cyprideis torosa]CAG0886707.1 unnamed protein product [Cyprideis torosa]
MTTVVESKEEKYEVRDMEDVIEDIEVEKPVEIVQGATEYQDSIKVHRTMTHSDMIVDQFENSVGKDFIEDVDVKDIVGQVEPIPASENGLEIGRTKLNPEAGKELECQSGTIDNHIGNVTIVDLDTKHDVMALKSVERI